MWLLCNLSFARELYIQHFWVCTQELKNFMCKACGLSRMAPCSCSQGKSNFAVDTGVAWEQCKGIRQDQGQNLRLMQF
jgi:hypothetical protein